VSLLLAAQALGAVNAKAAPTLRSVVNRFRQRMLPRQRGKTDSTGCASILRHIRGTRDARRSEEDIVPESAASSGVAGDPRPPEPQSEDIVPESAASSSADGDPRPPEPRSEDSGPESAASSSAAGDPLPSEPRPPPSPGARAPARLSLNGRSTLRSMVVGAAVFQTSAFWTWPSRPTPAPPRAADPLLRLPPPPAAAASYERVLMPRARRKLGLLTVTQPLSYFRDDAIEFVNVYPLRQSVVSCKCTRQVQVLLLKTEFGVITRTLDLVVAEVQSPIYIHSLSCVSVRPLRPRTPNREAPTPKPCRLPTPLFPPFRTRWAPSLDR